MLHRVRVQMYSFIGEKQNEMNIPAGIELTWDAMKMKMKMKIESILNVGLHEPYYYRLYYCHNRRFVSHSLELYANSWINEEKENT